MTTKFYGIILLIVLLSACQPSGMMDSKFNLDIYNNKASLDFYNSEAVSSQDWFLLNYAIKRQRNFYGYEIEGKTYREILEMARSFNENGLPVKTTFNDNGKQNVITQKIVDINLAQIQKEGYSKTRLRVVKFSCRYTNNTDKDVVIHNSSYQVFGPFKEHLTTIGYESNCLVPAKGTITINYLVEAKKIIDNLRFKENYYVKSLGTDEFLHAIDIIPSGVTVEKNTHGYSKCKHGSSSLEPFYALNYFNDIKIENCIQKDASGKVQTINLGDAHYMINDAQEVINLDKIGK